MTTSTITHKHNVCGIIVTTNYANKADLLAFLATVESCNIIDSTNTQLAAIIEDTAIRSAREAMSLIKEQPIVHDVTLINQFYK
ncbi:chaperone NapD [Ignatzschineria rhizosphaerae]|uniref:Chaperone NapD n=1 Tax=Ignatzschineria rhizosphaerae TaxID=2923279 RepID=A0ABY3X3X7_9GAMM|nr:chaperone NapD [Ignatzschineria rhizosphaerae]UNM96580.1 chaperone NapD [Ignatzschineria rhizosphaerae]